jgi:hypothetical protein
MQLMEIMMPAYLIADTYITDVTLYEDYKRQVPGDADRKYSIDHRKYSPRTNLRGQATKVVN